MNYFEFGPVVQEEMSLKEHFLSRAQSAPLSTRAEDSICVILEEGFMRNNSVRLF